MLRCPVPMVVTRPRPRRAQATAASTLRNGLRFKLRYLAVQNAARVIVPTQAVADDAERLLGIPSRSGSR